ncbi:MAG: rane fusion protein multidrug efflux system [Alphaproteobacteria bacterium]|jgi:multidrug efflux system membrane fusion protein|nr:rane fusion protein multidrug efflux system [Alphaproteobacteria bacterium]
MRTWKIGLVAATAIAAVVATIVILRNDASVIGGTAGAATPNPAMMAMPVPVAKIVRKTVPIYLDYSARTESIRSIALQAKVSGYIQQQHVADGADVKEGDLLYTIDPRDYQAALDLAKAQLQRDEAALSYARGNLDRGSSLAKSGFLAKDTFDQRNSAVGQGEATLAMSQAAVRTAELNLGYTQIRAPFAGRIGRNQAPVGTLITVGGAPLNTLVQLNPVYVTFNPSESDLAEIQKARAAGKVKAEVLLPGETKASHSGELTFLDNTVDRSTGTILARATIDNSDLRLLPGQYVRIRLTIGIEPDALMVPQAALGSSQLGKYVYVVGKDNKVDQRLVSLGATDGALVMVRSGISGDEKVISGNLQKIGPGAVVQPLEQ